MAFAVGSSFPALSRRCEQLFASPPVTSDVISKTDEPKQLRQARHRHRPRTSSARRTSSSSSGKRAKAAQSSTSSPTAPDVIGKTSRISSGKLTIANGLGRHHQDGRAAAAQTSAPSPTASDVITIYGLGRHHQDGRVATAQAMASASTPTAPDIISKTDEPKQHRQVRHRHRSRTSSARRTSCSSPDKRVVVNNLGRHQQDGRAVAAQASAPRQLSQARHRQRPRTSSARRTNRSS